MILIINKPIDMTSNDVVQIIKRKGKFKKVGHAGTLDPLATGVLVIGTNESTKELSSLILDDKEYIAEIKLGLETDTYDIKGNILLESPKKVLLNEISNAIKNFPSSYFQYPPKYSAIKIAGKKLYEYARSNIDVEIKPREVFIKKIELLSFELNIVKVKMLVSKGFYIRSFAMDLAKEVETLGTIISLVRTKSGNFSIENSKEIGELFV